MNRILSILIVILIVSCKSNNYIEGKSNKIVQYKIVQVPIVQESDTIISNELRFYKINSSLNSMQLMYDNFGKWNLILDGRYQTNVPQLIWQNVNLTNTEKSYTVSASGAETQSDFFTYFVVLDEYGKDVLLENNENRKIIIEYFKSQMAELGNAKSFYSVYPRQ